MNYKLEFETYLNISINKYEIFLLDVRNKKNIYKDEFIIENLNESENYSSLKLFLDNNIFKIEKLIGKFVKNIFLIIDNKEVFNIYIGIKKKNYNIPINKDYLKNSLTEAKDLFNENYRDKKIIHIIINKYLINNETYISFKDNLEYDQISLEVQIKSISYKLIDDLNKILNNYQINIIKYLDGKYVKNFFEPHSIELSEMCHRILNGENENEVNVVKKIHQKKGFFEKFFQLFS